MNQAQIRPAPEQELPDWSKLEQRERKDYKDFRRVPDFDQMLLNVAKEKKVTPIRARYTYLPEQAGQIRSSIQAGMERLPAQPFHEPLAHLQPLVALRPPHPSPRQPHQSQGRRVRQRVRKPPSSATRQPPRSHPLLYRRRSRTHPPRRRHRTGPHLPRRAARRKPRASIGRRAACDRV